MSDDENNVEESDNGACFENRPMIDRSPTKTSVRKMTRSMKKLSAVEESGRLTAENEILHERNNKLLERIEALERKQPDYSRGSETKHDGLTNVLTELCRRMQALESREKRDFRGDELNERTSACEFGYPNNENTA